MSVSTDTPPIDLLPLTFCPNCDYSLQGLPPSGTCPECGRSYDQSFIVLRGKPVRDYTNDASIQDISVTPRRFVQALVVPAFMLFAIGLPFQHPLFFVFVSFMLADACLGLMVWHDSLRRGEVLVWISSQGIGQEPTEDRRLLAARLRRWIRLAFIPGLIGVQFISARPMFFFDWIAGGAFMIFWGAFLLSKNKYAGDSICSVGTNVTIFGWKLFNFVALESAKGNRWQLRAHVDSRFRSSNLVNIEFAATDDVAFKLRTLTTQWHSSARQSISSSPGGPTRGRRIGRAIRQIFLGPATQSQPV
jgi:hypothetical protein